jgi:phenylalanyl-tRNA synthetase alpha chain
VSTALTLEELTGQLEALEAEAAAAIAAAPDGAALEQLRIELLGKKGKLSGVLGAMGKLPGDQRPLVGQRANVLKEQVQGLLQERLQKLRTEALAARIAAETLDITMPASYGPPGHRHPLLSTTDAIVDIFCGLGYRVVEGPDIETDHYNFSSLNIPPDHPARDMQDTFYLPGERLLRTHTSPVQIRHLEANPPPVRVIAPGRVYRRDAVDEGLSTRTENWGWFFWKKGMKSRKLMDFFSGKTKNRLLQKFFSKSWAKHRELPQVAEQSFSQQWKTEHSPKKG